MGGKFALETAQGSQVAWLFGMWQVVGASEAVEDF